MTLDDCRRELDEADRALLAAFVRRMELSAPIADWKRAHGLPIRDEVREREKLAAVRAQVPPELAQSAEELYRTLFRLSRELQSRRNGEA